MALDTTHVLLHVAAQVLNLAQHHARMRDESLTRRGQRHALAGAVQQLGANALFEVLDARARGRQGNEGQFRSARHAVCLSNAHHQTQIHKIKMHGHARIVGKLAPFLPQLCGQAQTLPSKKAKSSYAQPP